MNPYKSASIHAFWQSGVSSVPWHLLDPMVDVYPIITKETLVSSAGSCFAQHVARYIRSTGYRYHVVEGEEVETLFSAAYGNIYTTRQLVQLIKRAWGYLDGEGAETVWRRREDGLWIDAFRPTVSQPMPDKSLIYEDRLKHLRKVKKLFETTNVFIFTLGMTECWSARSGLVFPVAPGVLDDSTKIEDFSFNNLRVSEIVTDFQEFLSLVRAVNPSLKIILTVSPVPFRATYEKEHVLTANCYSKSALRAAAYELVSHEQGIFYFPSYEIFTGTYTSGQLYQNNLREVTAEGIKLAMSCFFRHFTAEGQTGQVKTVYTSNDDEDVLCDESFFI